MGNDPAEKHIKSFIKKIDELLNDDESTKVMK